HHHHFDLVGAHDRHAAVGPVAVAVAAVADAAIGVRAVVGVVVVVVADLAQASLQAHVGTDQQVGAATPGRAQAVLVEGAADRLGQLRRVGTGTGAGQLAVAPAPAAIAPVVTRGCRVGTGIEGA